MQDFRKNTYYLRYRFKQVVLQHGVIGYSGQEHLYGLYLRIHAGLQAFVDQELHHRKFKGKYPEVLEFMEEQVQRSMIFQVHGYLREAARNDRRKRVEQSRIMDQTTKQFKLGF